MESINDLRFYCFVIGVVMSVLALISRAKVESYENNGNRRMYEMWQGILSTLLGLAILSIATYIFTFPLESLLNAIKNAVSD